MKKKVIDIEKILAKGGDVYQTFALEAGCTRAEAKIILFPYFYGQPRHGKTPAGIKLE